MKTENKSQAVTVTDLDIKFTTMVNLLLKLALAAIPAILVLVLAGVVLSTFILMLFGIK